MICLKTPLGSIKLLAQDVAITRNGFHGYPPNVHVAVRQQWDAQIRAEAICGVGLRPSIVRILRVSEDGCILRVIGKVT